MIKRTDLKALMGRKSSKVLLGLVLVLLVLPMMSRDKFFLSSMVMTFLFAAFGVSWNIIGGYGAQISWCHAAFAACGAYTSFLAQNYLGLSPFLTIPVGMVISYLLATLIGYGTFKLRGSFFSIATIAFAEILKIILLYFRDFTGGASGKWIVYKGNNFWELTFKSDVPYYYITFVLLLLILAVTAVFEKSKTGYYLSAIKGDEDAATSLGIETFKVKLTAFQLSSVLASLVGTIYAYYLTYIDPYAICGMDLSVKIGMMAIVGGLGTLLGPVLGAFVLVPLTQISSALLGHVSGASMFLYGVVLVLVVLFKPEGLIALFTKGGGGSFLTKINAAVLQVFKKKQKTVKETEVTK